MISTPEAWAALPLRAHELLHDVPLHDVWEIDLPGGGEGRTIEDVRPLVSMDTVIEKNVAARALFGLRGWMGRVFGWDSDEGPAREAPLTEHMRRVPEAERAASLAPPGTYDGPFRTLLVNEREAIAEIRNPTVHAFLVMALFPLDGGYRFYWGIYVAPVGTITSWYMGLIDPFRRFVIYPAILEHVSSEWRRRFGG